MPVVSKATLKSYFETGDYPSQSNYVDLIDTLVSQDEFVNILIPKNAGFTAAKATRYLLDSTPGIFTVLLPASPVIGDWVQFNIDKASANDITIDGNGNNVNGGTTEIFNQNKCFSVAAFNGTEWVLIKVEDTSSLDARITSLESNEVILKWFEIVGTGSSPGTVSPISGATIVLDLFESSGDAELSTIDGNNKPTFKEPQDSSGNIVSTTMDVGGNYTFSSTPTGSQVAIIYALKISTLDWVNYKDANPSTWEDNLVEESDSTGYPIVTQIEAENGTSTESRTWTPQRVRQAIEALSGNGDVSGPNSSSNNQLVLMDGTTGKLIKESSNWSEDAGNIKNTNGDVLVKNVNVIDEGWESGDFTAGGWTIANGSETNQWVVGTAVSKSGTHSAYISNDGGTTAAYDNTSASIVHFYKQITFPADVLDCYLSFDFKCEGEAGFDFMEIRVMGTGNTPTAGVAITTGKAVTALQFSNGEFNEQTDYKYIKAWIDPQNLSNETKYLAFSWYNDGSIGTNPGAIIDNIKLTYQL